MLGNCWCYVSVSCYTSKFEQNYSDLSHAYEIHSLVIKISSFLWCRLWKYFASNFKLSYSKPFAIAVKTVLISTLPRSVFRTRWCLKQNWILRFYFYRLQIHDALNVHKVWWEFRTLNNKRLHVLSMFTQKAYFFHICMTSLPLVSRNAEINNKVKWN